ncbi:BnaC09g13300D [Brassica napus]|uniref:BnaC09g13300D protein n=1 Tax=Brassica napus TaxID=3708 RepID=A0A078H328_BRANA|nr:BnaC09g13300D [Brassica napus]
MGGRNYQNPLLIFMQKGLYFLILSCLFLKGFYLFINPVACCTRSFSFDTNGGAGTLHWGEYEWLSSASVFSKLEKQGRLPFCLWDGNTMVSPEELTSTGAVWRYSSLSRIIQVLSQRFLNFQLLEDISLD